MEAIGAVVHRPMAILSSGFTESVCQGRSMKIPSREATKKLAWSGSLSNSVFLDKGHLEYYNSNRFQKIGCRKPYAGSKTEKKMKKKDIEAKENKKRLKMLKGLSRDLLMLSKTGSGLGLDREAQPEMISDAVMQLQEQMQQLLTRENELMLKIKSEKSIFTAEQIPTLDNKMVSSCSSESSDSECNNDVVLDSDIAMQNPVLLLQGKMQKLRIKEKEVKQKRKEEKRSKKLGCGMCSSSSSESSDSECEELANMNTPSCFLLPAEKQLSNDLQEISTMFRKTAVLEENRVKDIGLDCITEIAEYTFKPAHMEESESTTKRLEVCMGGKCKKSGSLILMEEFQRVLGNEGAVSGCKCMGKCKNGPNVRVFKSVDGLLANGLVAEPIISVGLGDVGSIVANILGESGLAEARYG